MRTLLLAAAAAVAAGQSCQDTTAENFATSNIRDDSLCAYEPVYYCADSSATNYLASAFSQSPLPVATQPHLGVVRAETPRAA